LADGNPNVGLIVIDSITMHYRLTMRDETRRDERYGLTRQIAKLLRASRVRGIPVVVTSQVYTDIETGAYMPLGGHMLSHNAKTLVRSERTGVSARAAVVVQHCRAEEGRAILGRESLQGEDEQPSSLPLADVPFRGAADSGLDDAGAEEVVAVLERDREIPRERFERGAVFGRCAGRNRCGRRRTEVEAGRLSPAHPDVVGLGDSVRVLEIDVEALAIAEDEIDLSQFRKELEPDGGVEIRGPFNRSLREGPDPQRVEDGLRHAVSMALGPKDHRGAVGPGAAIQLRVRGPCAGQGPPPDVLIHDVVEEQCIEMVPLEPRRR